MAKKSMIEKQKRQPKYETRSYNRCFRCGRPRGYFRKFGLCRICLRELAHEGKIPGLTKSLSLLTGHMTPLPARIYSGL